MQCTSTLVQTTKTAQHNQAKLTEVMLITHISTKVTTAGDGHRHPFVAVVFHVGHLLGVGPVSQVVLQNHVAILQFHRQKLAL